MSEHHESVVTCELARKIMKTEGIPCYAALYPKIPYAWVWHTETVRQVLNDADALRWYLRLWELEHQGYATPCFATGQGEHRELGITATGVVILSGLYGAGA